MAASTQQPTSSSISAYKAAFLQSCLSANVLTFGTYTLKSGRQSPYFFNAGSFHTSALLSAISTAYAHTIIAFLASHPSIPKPDVLFGPAYKGIPLACTTLLELHRLSPETYSSLSYSFNRKEVKDHGEGGAVVGASLKGKNVLVIDDVITAGTAMRETIKLVEREGGRVVAFVVALDRMERMPGRREREGGVDEGGEEDEEEGEGERMSAMGMIRREFGVQTASIVTLDDLIDLLRGRGDRGDMEKLEGYRRRYLASD